MVAMNDLAAPSGVAIRVEALSKRFGSVQALDHVDLEVPAATIFGLLGPNGAGKTTTIRVLSTILPPDGGRAEVLGHDVVREPKAVRERIGLAGQYAAVDGNLTGRENLRLIGRLVHLPRRVNAERAADLLERFELTDAADRPVRTYSGGMRRRIDLAAALMNRPPVLFLDEPTTGLDPYSRNEVWRMVEELVADGIASVLYTDVARDGMDAGAALEATAAVARLIPTVASGGVRGVEDVAALSRTPGVVGVVVGTALYEGQVTLTELLAARP
jgi:ABC-type multidrug transport system ATPase subunit